MRYGVGRDWVIGLVWPLVSDDREGGSLVVGGGGGGKTTWRLRCGVVVGCGYE